MFGYSSVSFRLRSLIILLSASVILLLFSSWGKSGHNTHLLERAGIAAFAPALTHHTININGIALNYQAEAGYLAVSDQHGNSWANIFYTAYTLNNKQPERPVTFVFNGGPGSASIWLHMGAFGPVRVSTKQVDYQQNSYSWLKFTDLVFIDPVGTGYSQPADDVNAQQFYSYQNDIASIAAFIKAYRKQHNKNVAPIFLAGESYGAARAVGLAAYLQDSLQIKTTGLTLISPALNYRLLSFTDKNNTLPYTYYLPSYAVTAQYYRRLPASFEKLSSLELIARATHFSENIYTRFLNLGNTTPASFQEQVMDSLSYFTGISIEDLKLVKGRISDRWFIHTLLKSTGQTIGTFDSRMAGEIPSQDPSEVSLKAVFPKAFQEYMQNNLRYNNNLPYRTTITIPDWNYGIKRHTGYFDVSATLERLLLQNPTLKLNVAGGYYDLATPLRTTQYVIQHLHINKTQRKNIVVNYYPAGHMIYMNNQVNSSFQKQSQKFYHDALSNS